MRVSNAFLIVDFFFCHHQSTRACTMILDLPLYSPCYRSSRSFLSPVFTPHGSTRFCCSGSESCGTIPVAFKRQYVRQPIIKADRPRTEPKAGARDPPGSASENTKSPHEG